MIDDIDKGIVLDAHDDVELVRNLIVEISDKEGLDYVESFQSFVERFRKLKVDLPLVLYWAEKTFEHPTKEYVSIGEIRIQDVIDSGGEIVGPPYLHFTWRGNSDDEVKFSNFITRYGFP